MYSQSGSIKLKLTNKMYSASTDVSHVAISTYIKSPAGYLVTYFQITGPNVKIYQFDSMLLSIEHNAAQKLVEFRGNRY